MLPDTALCTVIPDLSEAFLWGVMIAFMNAFIFDFVNDRIYKLEMINSVVAFTCLCSRLKFKLQLAAFKFNLIQLYWYMFASHYQNSIDYYLEPFTQLELDCYRPVFIPVMQLLRIKMLVTFFPPHRSRLFLAPNCSTHRALKLCL